MSTIQRLTAGKEAQARVDDGRTPAAPRPQDVERTEVTPRQCGRCRQWFDGEPTRYPGAIGGWWLCTACRAALLGARERGSTTTREAATPTAVTPP